MKRLLSIFMSLVLAITMVPAIAIADTAYAADNSATGEFALSIHRREALAQTNFTVSLKSGSNTKTLTLNAAKGEELSELFATNIANGTYELTISGRHYVTYKQALDFDGRCIHLDLYNFQTANDGINSDAKLGVIPAGDVNGDGQINDTDADLVKNAIEKNNIQYDVSGDGKVDLDDVAFVVRNAGGIVAATPMHTISNAVLASAAQVAKSADTSINGNANSLLAQNKDGGSVALSPTSGTSISSENPVEISISTKNSSSALPSSQGIVIAPPASSDENYNTMAEGIVAVEGTDDKGNTVVYNIPVSADSTTQSYASLQSATPLTGYEAEEALAEEPDESAPAAVEEGASEPSQEPAEGTDNPTSNTTAANTPDGVSVDESQPVQSNAANNDANANQGEQVTGVESSDSATRYAAQPDEVTVENDGTVVINLGSRVAIKKVTIRVTATANQGNLAEIAKVEFLSDFAERVGEPQLSIPTITAVSNTNADGQGYKDISISWTPQTNVTGYEVSVSGSGYNKTAQTAKTSHTFKGDSFNGTIKSFMTYDVKVRSVSGDWRSSWSGVVKHTATCTNKPPAPQYVSVTSQVEKLQVKWNCKFDAEWFTLYYKEKNASGNFSSIPNITSSSYPISGLKPGADYQVYVVAHNRNGASPKSIMAEGTTLSSTLTGMPRYDLLNVDTANGMAITGIKSVTGNSNKSYQIKKADGSSVNQSKATYEDWKAILDNNSNSFLYIDDWDSGVAYANFRGPKITLNEKTVIDTFRFSPSDKVSSPALYSAVVGYKDYSKNGSVVNVSASLSTKYDKDKHKYYEVVTNTPIYSDYFELRLRTLNTAPITIQELKLYNYNSLDNDIAALFTDDTRTMVKDTVTEAQVQALIDRSNAVDPVSGEVHPHNATQMIELNYAMGIVKNGAHKIDYISVDNQITSKGEPSSGFAQSLSDYQPLGYVAADGDSLIVYVTDDKNKVSRGASVNLNMVFTQMYPEVTAWQKSVALKAGRNEITVPRVSSLAQEHGGAIYLQYTGNKGACDYKVRVLGGNKIPVLNVTGVYGADRSKAVANYAKELKAYCNNLQLSHKSNHDASSNKSVQYGYSAGTCILNNTDICMDNMMYSFPATQVNAALGATATDAVRQSKLEKTLEAMETQIDYFYQFKGLHKSATDNDRYPKLRLNIRYHRMFTGAFMYAAGKHIGIGWGSVGGAFAITPVKANANGEWTSGSMTGWGISHEIGHCINASAYQRVEVTNNVFAQIAKGASSDGETSAKFRANYNNVYKGVAAGNVCHNGDLKVQLAQYWQLHLAYDTNYHTYKLYDTIQDQQANLFYARMESYLRTRSKLPIAFEGNPGGDQLFMQAACAAANKNVLEYFEAWGYKPNTDTMKYAAKFAKEARKIQYVNDDARLWKLAGKKGMSTGTSVKASITNATDRRINGNTVKINLSNTNTNPDAMLGYEIKRNGKIVGFVLASENSFTDILTTENNKVFNYEVTGVDKLLNTTAKCKIGEVKLCHDGAISKANWTATSTTASSKQDTLIDIKDDNQLEGDDGFDPDAGTVEGTTLPGKNVVSAAKNAIDYNNDTIFCAEGGKDANRPNIVLNLGGTQQVTALKYTPASKSFNGKASNTIADNAMYQYRPYGYKIELSTDGNNWTTVKEGNLYKNSKMDNPTTWIPNDDVIVNNDSNVNEDKSITVFFSKPDSDSLQTYDAGYVRLTATNMTAFATAEIDILGPTSDNVELTPEGYGNLSSPFTYGDRPEDVIPVGSRVMYGEYKGDPSYNVVILKDQNGNVIDGQFIILANVPAKGKLGETSNGRWVFWMEDRNKVDSDGTTYNELKDFKNKNITSVQAELYRVQDAFTLAGQRLTSNSLTMTLPAESAVKNIQITTDAAKPMSSLASASASAVYATHNDEGVDRNGVVVFDEESLQNAKAAENGADDRVISGEETPMAAFDGSDSNGKSGSGSSYGDVPAALHSMSQIDNASAGAVAEMFATPIVSANVTQAELKSVNGGYTFRVNPSSISIASEGVFKFDSALPGNAKIDVKGLANATSPNATYNGSYRDSEGKLHVFVIARSGVLGNCCSSQENLSFTGSISGLAAKPNGFPEYIRDISGDYGAPVITNVAEGSIQILADEPTQRITSVTLSPTTFAYNKKARTPKVIVKSGNKVLRADTDYTVSYAPGRKKIGTYKVKVDGINLYTGSKTVSFQIVPKGTTIKKVKGKKKSMVVSFKKQVIETTGYKIRYSLKKNMKSARSVTIKKKKVTSATIKKLKSKKTYYVQIATIKKVGKTTYTSSWSKAKKVKIK